MKKEALTKLAEKFSPLDIEWRVQSCGEKRGGGVWARVLAYVDARAIQERLDHVCGPENWKDDYECLPKGMLCRLSIKIDGEWITKTNGAPETDIEGFKGGISKALVRAASTWGIGRYLYNLESPWAVISDEKNREAKRAITKEKKEFYWLPPELPKWALPTIEEIDPISDPSNERPAAITLSPEVRAHVTNPHGGNVGFPKAATSTDTPFLKCKCSGVMVHTKNKDAYRCQHWTQNSGKHEHDYMKPDMYEQALRAQRQKELDRSKGKVS